jgi:hypothetical protein
MMQDIQDFLSKFERGLEVFERRIRENRGGLAVVTYLPNPARAPEQDEVAIGTGKFAFPVPDGGHAGLCLNDKQAGFTSVAELVFNAPPELFAQWRGAVGEDATPEAFLGRFRLIVEDASPDSCFGLLCLLMRLAGVAKEAIPADWITYIAGWERGDIVVGESVSCAYGALHNALVHAKIDDDIAGAWVDGLRLMTEALRSGERPVAIPLSVASAVFLRARALLRFEEQRYEESLAHAISIQLALPIADARNRYRLVDAYLSEMTLPLGALKVFARTDRVHPFLKNGFTLLALYRAKPSGDGDDATISVDQSAGVELRDLWLKFEEAEDRAWGADRPHDASRRGIVGYPNQKRPDGRDSPNEPWFDGRDYSLVAAPKKLADGRLGSKLPWHEVLETLWQTYQPFQHVRVRPGVTEVAANVPPADEKLKLLHECYPETLADDLEEGADTPRLFVAGWYRPDSSAPAFNVTPTFCKYLAACIRRWRPALPGEAVALAELPDESAYDVFKLPGLVAVVSADGAFLVYDGQRLKPPLYEMKSEFERAARIRQRIGEGAADLAKFLDDLKAFFGGRRRDLVEDKLLQRLTSEQIEIAVELHKAHAAVVSHEARRFREAVLNRWGIESWLDSLARDIAQIKNVLYGRAGLEHARRIALVETYGIPVAVAAALYGFGLVSDRLWHWPPDLGSVNWPGLITILLLSALIFCGAKAVTRWRRRSRLKSLAALGLEMSRPTPDQFSDGKPAA